MVEQNTRQIRTVWVELEKRRYPITIGYNILPQCIAGMKDITSEKEVFLISDENVYERYGSFIEKIFLEQGYQVLPYVILPGEGSKSWEQAGLILEKMLENKLGRKVPVIALGGGVVGDLSGFVAALYRRGVPFVQIPTTLLAQVDSSVGGKVAVNHPLGKNMLGSFYQPQAVWADLAVLDSLPQEEWRAGLAEVLKYALIQDGEFFNLLEKHAAEILAKSPHIVPEIIERCCQIKAEIVSRDEKDEGLRNTLNLGHTFGHALESATGYKKYRHGEAVAIGIVGAMYLAQELGFINEELILKVKKVIMSWGLPISFPEELLDCVLAHLQHDKKVTQNKLVFVLPIALGQVTMQKDLPREKIIAAFKKLTVKKDLF